jgi:acyl-CoA synthetase (NDP forming)
MAARVERAGGAMLGPNCMGVAVPGGASPWLARLPQSFRRGHVAAVVQSGSVGEALVAVGPRVGFRAIVSSGAEAVTGAAELLSFFAADDETRAVALFLETVRRPRAFAEALERCLEREKPVVCLKVGRSATAARTALAHTGAIVGSERAFSALLRRHGALEVRDLPELVETLEVLGRRRWPRGVRTAAVSESGGEAALLADHGSEHGLRFDELPRAVTASLQRRFPDWDGIGNPVDAWGVDAPEHVYPACLELIADAGCYDVLIAQVDLSRFRDAADQEWNALIVRALGAATRRGTLFGAVITSHTTDPPEWAQELAAQLDLALLRGARDATAAIARVARWRPVREAAPEWTAPVAIDDLVTTDGALPEHESSAVLERYGIPFARRRRARDPHEAARAATELGGTVVVKADGPAHKSRAGGVILGVRGPAEARAAAQRLGGRVLVAAQLDGGAELFCGMTRDEHYGPVVAVGTGGSGIDGARPAVSLAPLGPSHARALVEDAGLDDADGTFVHAVQAVGRLAAEHPEVVEVDINPFIVSDSGVVAVDALLVVDRERRRA